ncbi:MAG: hypothetical protein M3Q60_15205, partial [Actinomycetota bacterium]|nr:hypothetical protein [Actinomycetota bacterium]
LFCRVFGHAGAQKFRHVFLFSFPGRRFGHELMCTAFEERSTRSHLINGEGEDRGDLESATGDVFSPYLRAGPFSEYVLGSRPGIYEMSSRETLSISHEFLRTINVLLVNLIT